MRRRSLTCLAVMAAAAALLHAPAAAGVTDGPCSGNASGDFDGDGFADLAVGVPEEDIGTLADAGAVNVIYGSAGGLTAADDDFWSQAAGGIDGAAEAGDRFGACLVAGDFNGDGEDDLAVGVPGEDLGTLADAGAVNVIYGSAATTDDGLSASATADQVWHQNTPGIGGVAEAGDAFGGALSAGDVNGDGEDDLAIGVPLEDIGSKADAGAVNVLMGSAESGLTAAGDQVWHQDVAGIGGAAEADDKFGSALAAADYNADAIDDLAVGVPEEDLQVEAGAVNVIYGSSSGLSATADQVWTQNSAAVEGAEEAGDLFGRALAAGDFDGDAFDDLAIGAPREDVGGIVDAGAVNVLYGSASRLTASPSAPGATADQLLTQGGISSSTGFDEAGDRFGSALAAGSFDGDIVDDLAVGSPFEDVSLADVGAVDVLYGTAAGLSAAGGDFWTQAGAVEEDEDLGDAFGAALTTGSFNGDASADLAIGVPSEDNGTTADAGAINVIYGAGSGLSETGPPSDQLWHQGAAPPGAILDALEADDMFGSAAG